MIRGMDRELAAAPGPVVVRRGGLRARTRAPSARARFAPRAGAREARPSELP
jgi:hypothetical protein